MENKLNKNLKKFLNKEIENEPIINQSDEIIITQKDGLMERVDKKLVMSDGRQLLKEQLFEIN